METLKRAAADNSLSLFDAKLADLLDEADPLRELRDSFHHPLLKTVPGVDPSLLESKDASEKTAVYFVGNSLGLQPKGVRANLDRELSKWSSMGVEGHFEGAMPWAACDETLTASMARLVGAEESEVALMNGLSVNLHLLLVSFYRPQGRRVKVMMEAKAFPSDHYAVESQIRLAGGDPEERLVLLEPREGEECLRTEDVERRISEEGSELALLLLPGVQYYTGQLFDVERLTAAGRGVGAVVGWDLAHAVGNVPLRLHDWGADFAVWCSYKYLNSGAGGLAGLFVHDRHEERMEGRLTGWWSHEAESRFAMDNELRLSSGAGSFRLSNPPMLLAAALRASLDVFDRTDMESLRTKSLLLTAYLEALLTSPESPVAEEVRLITPREPSERGAQLSLAFRRLPMEEVFAGLKRSGVLVDKRSPDVIRVAPAPLYNSFRDVHRFYRILSSVVECLQE